MDYRLARLYHWWAKSQGARSLEFSDVLDALTTFTTDEPDKRQGRARRLMNKLVDAASAAGIKVIHRKHGEE